MRVYVAGLKQTPKTPVTPEMLLAITLASHAAGNYVGDIQNPIGLF
jgi:hypothetical protein